jgi:hypothetical protein
MNCSSASAAIFGEHLYVGTYSCGPLWIPPFQVWRTEGGIFADGFESGDASAWSATVPWAREAVPGAVGLAGIAVDARNPRFPCDRRVSM